MQSQFKKPLSIIAATIAGVIIIFVAFKSTTPTKELAQNEGDTTWKNTLSVVPQNNPSSVKGAYQGTATTTTDLVARELLVSYALTQKNNATTTISDTDAEAIAAMMMEKAQPQQATVYTEKDLVITSDNSNAAFTTYSKNLSATLSAFNAKHKTSEISIVVDAINTNNEQKLQELTPIIAQYETLKQNLLAIKTPSEVATLHLRLVQEYANIEDLVISMQSTWTDPARGLMAISQYKKEIAALDALAVEYRGYTPAP